MSRRLKLTGLVMTGVLCLTIPVLADTPAPQTTPRTHTKKKTTLPPPLPSGTRGPVPQIPLDAIPAVAPQVSYEDGMLTIVAPNSTLGDILRGVRKRTSADIEIPPTASERVVARLGPAPAREVMAELLNGSHFNYILLGSPENANALVRVVLVAKTGPDTPEPQAGNNPAPPPQAAAPPADTPEADAAADAEDTDQNAAEVAEPAPPAEQPGVRTPQQLLQEMQQRQLQMQQQQQGAQPGAYPPAPGMPVPHQPQAPQDPQ